MLLTTYVLTLALATPQTLTPTQQREDLAELVHKLQTIHPKPYRVHEPETWERVVDEVHTQLGESDDFRFYAELSRVTGLTADGHTGMFDWAPVSALVREKVYPLRFRWFADGLYVMSAEESLGDLVGSRVLSFSGVATEEAVERVLPYMHADNRYGALLQAPNEMIAHHMLDAMGLTRKDGTVELEVEFEDGERLVQVLPPAGPLSRPSESWIDIERDTMDDLPLWLGRRDQNYWFEHIAHQKAVYLQFNSVRDARLKSFASLCHEMFDFIENNDVERLVIDLRHNGGGNNYKNQPLIHGLIRSDKLREPGSLFVLTSARTFSAAMNCSADMERNTQAIFVGEPTGSGPNLAGDTETYTLNHSGIRVRISHLWWQGSDPRDMRRTIRPDHDFPITFASYTSGEDAALEFALTHLPEKGAPVMAPNTRWQRASQQ